MDISPAEQRILESILSLKTDVASIDQNVKNLTDKVTDQAKQIENNRNSIVKNDVIISKLAGGLCVIMFLTTFFANYLMSN